MKAVLFLYLYLCNIGYTEDVEDAHQEHLRTEASLYLQKEPSDEIDQTAGAVIFQQSPFEREQAASNNAVNLANYIIANPLQSLKPNTAEPALANIETEQTRIRVRLAEIETLLAPKPGLLDQEAAELRTRNSRLEAAAVQLRAYLNPPTPASTASATASAQGLSADRLRFTTPDGTNRDYMPNMAIRDGMDPQGGMVRYYSNDGGATGIRIDGQGNIFQFNGNSLGVVGAENTSAIGRVTYPTATTATASTGTSTSTSIPTTNYIEANLSRYYTNGTRIPATAYNPSVTTAPVSIPATQPTTTRPTNRPICTTGNCPYSP